jgi:hypothetical protein
MSVNVSSVKENVDNEYRRLTQVVKIFENKILIKKNFFLFFERIWNKNLII